jgi:hypothetical protein
VDPLSGLPHEVDQRPNRERRAEEVSHHLPHPRLGDELLLDQISAQRAQARTMAQIV